MKEIIYQYKSGLIEFYLRGELYAFKQCKHTNERLSFMLKQLRQTKNLKGERYFLWMPKTKEIEVR